MILKACFLNGEGDKLNSFTVGNDLPGATQLRDKILQAIQSNTVNELRIGLEPTSELQENLFGGCATKQKPNPYAQKERNK